MSSLRCVSWRKVRGSRRSVRPGSIIIDLPSAAVANERKTQVISRALQAETETRSRAAFTMARYKSKQASLFQQQLDLAVELKLNVVIHQRDAWDDTLEIMRDYGRR